jgi:uncharacterized protein YbaR (Trm112 family)/SAM-dependent methyltransferase
VRLRLLNWLVCPVTKHPLRLLVWDERANALDDAALRKIADLSATAEMFDREIVSGALLNDAERLYYPIYNGVPRMLTYDCGVFGDFKEKFRNRIAADLKTYSTPALEAPVGEHSVISSFSREWLEYDWNPEKYWKINSDVMDAVMRFMLDLENRSLKNRSVLEVGIGIGGIANSIARNEDCELVGVDLGYAVDGAYKNFHDNLFFHIVQASAFRLPFNEGAFDYVYSHGVLHHSSDPRTCFMNVSKLPRSKGYLYVWLYSDTSENRNIVRRSLMVMEKVLRPLIWRLPESAQNAALFPLAVLYIVHQNVLQGGKDDMVRFSWREAYHAARDRFTPRYAFRYSEEELASWYYSAGYDNLLFSSKRIAPTPTISEFCLATAIIGQKK